MSPCATPAGPRIESHQILLSGVSPALDSLSASQLTSMKKDARSPLNGNVNILAVLGRQWQEVAYICLCRLSGRLEARDAESVSVKCALYIFRPIWHVRSQREHQAVMVHSYCGQIWL